MKAIYEYNLTTKLPWLLGTCGHTFCSSCLYDIIINNDEVFCPEDNVKYIFYNKETGLESFPLNLAL